jgi:hypothetical protein
VRRGHAGSGQRTASEDDCGAASRGVRSARSRVACAGGAAGPADPAGGGLSRRCAAENDTTVAAPARRLDVDWHILWTALRAEAQRRAADPTRLQGVESLGVDEHVWRPGKFGAGREVTCMVDLSRDANGQVRARLLDLVLGRSGPAYAGWLDAQQPEFRAQITSAALDPFRGYANARRDSLSDAVQVLDAFHVVKVRHEAPCIPSGGERPPPPGCHSSPVKLRAA